ncbi:MAG: hypothetical protein R3F43_25255 [bacterium]
MWMAHQLGPAVVLDRLRAVGFESLIDRPPSRPGPGAGERRGALAGAGVGVMGPRQRWPRLPRWQPGAPAGEPVRVMPAGVAHLPADILADPVARAPVFWAPQPLRSCRSRGRQDGHRTDFTDNWTVGFTTAVTVAV